VIALTSIGTGIPKGFPAHVGGPASPPLELPLLELPPLELPPLELPPLDELAVPPSLGLLATGSSPTQP